MEMTFRWYGSQFDTVTLKQIRQIAGVTGVITTLYDMQPGEVWSRERIRALKEEVEAAIDALGKGASVRGETLTLEEFARLSDLLSPYKKG